MVAPTGGPTVTDGLDIVAALGLLLKLEGILVKNETHLEKLSEVFQHAIQLHFMTFLSYDHKH